MAAMPTATATDAVPAGVRNPARPNEHQRAALRGILAEVRRPAPDCALTLLYSRNRHTEAAWLCAFARSAGTRVEFAAWDGVPSIARRSERAAIEAAAPAAAASGNAVIVVSDRTLSLPAGVLALPGVPGANAVDLWEPRERIGLLARRFLDALAPRVTLRTGCVGAVGVVGATGDAGAGLLTASLGRTGLGDPFGCVDADATGVSGTFIADEGIEVNRAVCWDARLSEHPVTLDVLDGRVASVSCRNPVLHRFLTRAVRVHRAEKIRTLRFGLRRLPGGAVPPGPVCRCRQGTVTLRLGVDADERYNPASADLLIELSAAATVTGHAYSGSGMRGVRP